MSAPTGLTCEAINDNFQRETGRIQQGTYRLGLYKDPLLRLVTKSAFPDHMGKVITNTIAQRTVATGSGWEDINISDGASVDGCAVPVKKVSYAFDQNTFSLKAQALESDWICLEDVRTSTFPEDDINNYIKGIQDNINVEWIKRYDDDLLALSDRKVVVAPGLPEDDTAFPSTAPTSPLTMGVLRNFHQALYEDNAGDNGDAVTDDGAPVFHVLSDRATIENLIKLNDDLRQDVRWSDRVNDLLGPNGATLLPKKAYAGLMFHSRPFPKRFNDDGAGGYTEVAPYSTTAATKGTKAVISAAYKAAKYGSSQIFVPAAQEWLVPNANMKVGGKVVFGPQNYTGDLKWVNKYDRTCNPDENSGFFRAKMASAVKSIMPSWSVYLLHLRCNLADDLVACSSGSGYGYLR